MLVFIVPLRNRSTTRDWGHVSQLCERALRSCCAQHGGDFRVFLVCRELPEMDFSHPALTVLREDFPDPGDSIQAREVDKFAKLQRGLVAARSLAPAHFMFADADDLVHRDLAALVALAPEAPGWHLPLGYLYQEPTRRLYRWPDFDLFCGTSAIIRCTAEDLPESVEEPAEKFFLLAQGHPVIRRFMAERGTPLRAVPFPAAIYITGTGQNHTGMNVGAWQGRKITLQRWLRRRPLSARVRAEFGLYDLAPAGQHGGV